jgi:hypothetical protein
VSETLIERGEGVGDRGGKGLPKYTYLRAPGKLWRSRYDEKNNLVVVNNGHRDYLYAAQKRARKLKYICRLFCRELVLANFPGFDSRELLERVIELSLYVEENLREGLPDPRGRRFADGHGKAVIFSGVFYG